MPLKKKFLLIITSLLFLNGYTLLSQTQHLDSLINLSFSELKNGFIANTKDSSLSNSYAKAYLIKAKKLNDSNQIANGYYLKSIINIEHPEKIKLYDSIISLTKNFKNKNFPTIAYLDKGIILYNDRKFKDALNNFILALDYNDGDNKEYLDFLINICIATLKSRVDLNKEALELFRKCWKYANKNDHKTSQPERYFNLLASISNSLRKNKLIDSAYILNSRGLKESKELNLSDNYYDFVLNDGVLNFHKKKYNTAYDSIRKSLKYIKKLMPNQIWPLAIFI